MVVGADPDCLRFNQAYRQGHIGSSSSGIAGAHKDAIARSVGDLLRSLQQAGIVDATFGTGKAGKTSGAETGVADETGQRFDSSVVDAIVEALVSMKKDKVRELTEQALVSGTDPMLVLDASKRAMAEVGRLFETEEYFVPELILAGRMLKSIAEAVKPYLTGATSEGPKKGRVIIGTVEGDIHDIGKDIVVTMLDINGYEVMDLGVDVPIEQFVKAAREFRPRVIGLSGFLTLAYDPMKDTITAIRQECTGDIKFMIGGGQIDEHVRVYAGADAFGNDAMDAVRLCEKWITTETH
jgi:5-methyltetrahydrofolate--homocysteine methyltransferase